MTFASPKDGCLKNTDIMRRFMLAYCLVILGCGKNNPLPDTTRMLPDGLLSYPYVADKERANTIKAGLNKLKVGDTLEVVVSIMGRPDELNPTFDKSNWDKRVGYSLVYVIQRDKQFGSVIEKNEILVRVHFKFDDVVSRVDMVGIQ